MTRARNQSAGTHSHASEATTVAEEIRELRAAVERLAHELRIMREVVDDVRECFEWGVQNDKFAGVPRHVMHITSMPKDPCDHAWGEKLNALPPAELDR